MARLGPTADPYRPLRGTPTRVRPRAPRRANRRGPRRTRTPRYTSLPPTRTGNSLFACPTAARSCPRTRWRRSWRLDAVTTPRGRRRSRGPGPRTPHSSSPSPRPRRRRHRLRRRGPTGYPRRTLRRASKPAHHRPSSTLTLNSNRGPPPGTAPARSPRRRARPRRPRTPLAPRGRG